MHWPSPLGGFREERRISTRLNIFLTYRVFRTGSDVSRGQIDDAAVYRT
jgi:hypothetical protein